MLYNQSIAILVAIRWVAMAWSQVTAETITKCFRKAGILDGGLDVVNRGVEDDSDPFIEADERIELEGLIEKTGDGGCSLDEFLTGDSDLPVCVEMDNDNWDETFFDQLGQNQDEVASRESDEEDDSDDQEELPKLKSYKEAVLALEDVSKFLVFKGHGEEAIYIGQTIDRIVNIKHQSRRQTTLHTNSFTNFTTLRLFHPIILKVIFHEPPR